jgi:hypothetical protein
MWSSDAVELAGEPGEAVAGEVVVFPSVESASQFGFAVDDGQEVVGYAVGFVEDEFAGAAVPAEEALAVVGEDPLAEVDVRHSLISSKRHVR